MRKSLDFNKRPIKASLWERLDWRQALAIDLGSNEVRIFRTNRAKKSQAEVLTIDQACVAIKKNSRNSRNQVLAVGRDALEMRERLGNGIEVVFPIIAGRIIDEKLAKILLKELLKKALKMDRVFPFVMSPVLVVTVRAGTSDFSRNNLAALFYDLGVSEVHLLVEPLAAAIGAGMPIADATGVMLMQMGASSVEVAALALGSIVSFQSSLWNGISAGWDLDELLRAYLLKEHHLSITLEASETLKKDLIVDEKENFQIKLLGKDLISRKAKSLSLENHELLMVILPVVKDYLMLVENLLQEIPNALLSDVLDRGLLLSGNLAKLAGLDRYLAQALKIPVALVDDPDLAVAIGALTVLENLDFFKASLAFRQ